MLGDFFVPGTCGACHNWSIFLYLSNLSKLFQKRFSHQKPDFSLQLTMANLIKFVVALKKYWGKNSKSKIGKVVEIYILATSMYKKMEKKNEKKNGKKTEKKTEKKNFIFFSVFFPFFYTWT